MSRLEELIQEYCPGGVKFDKLVNISNILYGYPCDASKFNDNRTGMPLIRIRDVLAGTSNTYTTEEISEYYIIRKGDLLVGMDGNFHVGNWKDNDGYLCQRVCKICSKDEKVILNRFLSHYLPPIMKQIEANKLSGTVKHLLAKDINAITIPVPPLPVQEEIVRILDNFTELTAELQKMLDAELQARKKQYEYYRDALINTSSIDNVELRSVVKRSSSGGTPKKNVGAFYQNGTIPWIRTQDVAFNEITEVDSFITEEAVKKTSAKWIPENCVIVAISGATAGRCAINRIKATTNQHCLNLEIDESKALYKYVYYCICSRYNALVERKQGARGDLNSSLILGIEIPVPSLDEQKRIVAILDRFDTLCNNLSSGLPAEIQARQKQYEYYRDKLLTFPPLS